MNTMDETKRNSMRLDIEAVRLSENDHDQQPTETYKQVSEFNSNEKSTGEHTTFFNLYILENCEPLPTELSKPFGKTFRNELLASA